jgi:hypothetical protein
MNDEFDLDVEGRVIEEIEEMILDFYHDETRIHEILHSLDVPINGATIKRVQKTIQHALDEVRNTL